MAFNTAQLWKAGLLTVIVLCVAYMAFTGIPYSVSKTYHEAIYKGGHVVQTVPIKVSGKVYRGIFVTNEFIGTVGINGKLYSIVTFRNPRILGGAKNSYPYLGAVTAVRQNETVTTAIIEMSRDFDSVVACTDAIAREYGKGAELTVPAISTISKK